jgi:SAM-dependent methyltransferase
MELRRLNPILQRPTRTRASRYSRPPWRLVECLETGLVYLENPPDYSELKENFAWEKTHAEESARRTREDPIFSAASDIITKVRRPDSGLPKVEREALQFLCAYTAKPPPLRMLDVGCASGLKARRIAATMREEHGINVIPIGIEISDALASLAEEKLAAHGGYVIHSPALEGLQQLAGASIDLIILSSYLEHELLPLEALRSCAAKLAPDGRIIIKVPNFASLNRRVRGRRWCGFRYPDHVNYFTPSTLKLLVARAGLVIARMNIFDRLPTNDNMWLIGSHPAA